MAYYPFGVRIRATPELLAGLDPDVGPIFTHGAVEKLNADYRAGGVALPATTYVGDAPAGTDWSRVLIVAPPSAQGSAVKKVLDIISMIS